MRSRRALRTILFTDLVGSTERAAELGDQAWRELRDRHHSRVRRVLRRWGAREINEAGDGFLAVLDSPARGLACAVEIRDAVQSLGLAVRCGVHMGGVEQGDDGSVGGIGVHIGARVAALAEPGEILASRAVRDAEEGSGFTFADRGVFELKGIQGERHLYRVTGLPPDPSSLVPGRRERLVSAFRGRPSGIAVGAAAVVLVVLGAALIAREGKSTKRPSDDSERVAAAGVVPIDRSIAVLPFDNLSADPEDAFFAEGMTDDVMAALSKLDDLRVISRTSVLQYRETTKPVRQIASELGVGTVLEGTVRRAGDQVRITVQLIDARTDEHLWAEQYDRELVDVFAIQSEIAEAIAERLHAELAAEERRRIQAGQTNDPDAYLLVLRARERRRNAIAQFDRYEEEMRASVELLRQAVGRDPGYARAHADLASAYSFLAEFQGGSWADSSEAAARRAIELDPDLAAAHRALGDAGIARGRFSVAIESYRRAVALDPNDGDAIGGLGYALFVKGRLDEALREILTVASLDPGSPRSFAWVADAYRSLELLDGAESWSRRAVEVAPDQGVGHANQVLVRLMRGDTSGARAALEEGTLLSPSDGDVLTSAAYFATFTRDWEAVRAAAERLYAQASNISELAVYTGYAYERLGDRAHASELYEEAERDALRRVGGTDHPLAAYTLAILGAVRGDGETTFRWLEEAYARGYRQRWWLTVDPLFERVRDDPRFEDLLERMDADLARMRERARREGLVRMP